jgi:hypothetical protein
MTYLRFGKGARPTSFLPKRRPECVGSFVVAMMRKLAGFSQVTLDGYFAGMDGDMSWAYKDRRRQREADSEAEKDAGARQWARLAALRPISWNAQNRKGL